MMAQVPGQRRPYPVGQPPNQITAAIEALPEAPDRDEDDTHEVVDLLHRLDL